MHVDLLLDDVGQLYGIEEFSDVVLDVGQECIPAHRMILASRSEYFKALLYGGLKETNEKKICLSEDTHLSAFRCILQYIYTGIMDFTVYELETILNALVLANKYGLQKLEKTLVNS